MAIDNLIKHTTHFKKSKPSSNTIKLNQAATLLVQLANTGSRSRHSCSVCGKSFSSYQALGGHKSSHRSKPHANVTNDVITQHVSKSSERRIHECNICGKAFSTGQALGGHKRKHFKRRDDDVVGGDKSGVTFDDDDGGGGAKVVSLTSGRVVFDIDLNVSPPFESWDEEEVDSSRPSPLILFP